MIAPVNNGDVTYWMNGLPDEGLRNPTTNTGSNRYWMDGLPEEELFLLTNADTGRFFLLFE